MTASPRPIRGRAALARAGQVLVSYAVGSVAETIVFSEMRGGGHADAPFSMFPEYLLLSPIMPVIVAVDFFRRYWWLELFSTGVFVGCFIGTWILYSRLRTYLTASPRPD